MRKTTILLIDDDEDFIKLFETFADKIDPCNQVITATTIVEGYLKVQKQNFNIIFTDYNLPHFNGVDFIKTIRKIDGNKTIPIVLVTSSPEKIDISKSFLENVYKLKKPISQGALKEALETTSTQKVTPKEKVDTEFVNSVLVSFKDILEKLAYFDDIKKLETKRHEIEQEHDFDYFACFMIKGKRFNGVITMGFPEETLVPYFSEVLDHAPDESFKSIFNAFSHLMLNRIKENLGEESVNEISVKGIVGMGEISTITANGSFLEFYNLFESSHGEFYIQISLWGN
jgi:CheY-like chemotaxis protein